MQQGGDARRRTVFGAIAGVVGGLFGFVTILILTFYMLVDAESLRASCCGCSREQRRARVDAASRDITVKVSAWLGGQLLLGAIIGTLLGDRAVADRHSVLLRARADLRHRRADPGGRADPLGDSRASPWRRRISLKKVLFVIVFFVVQQQFENHLLVPKIMARQVGVSAVTVIVALLIGGKLLGIVGAILAVPTAAILQVIFYRADLARRLNAGGVVIEHLRRSNLVDY